MKNAPTDHAGTVHTPAGSSARIISLVPSLTELLIDLGLGKHLVGRTRYCVHPAERVDGIPVIGGTKAIEADAVRALSVTHAVVNVDETPKDIADELTAMGVTVIVTHPNSVEDNPALFRLFGEIFHRQHQAETLCQRFDQALQDLKQTAAALPARRVLYLIWQKPWMTVSADTYIANTLGLVNWQTAGHDPDVRYPEVVMGEMIESGVDLVVFSSEPFPFTETHRRSFHQQFPKFDGQSAIIDAEMVSWYGSRALPGLNYLGNFAESLTA